MVDECPDCGVNHLDLFPDAFAALSDPSKGIIDVTWDYVDCALTAPLQLHLKDGVSAYWFSIQVVNARKAVESVDVSTDGGSTWQPTTRKDYNFFEKPSGFGTTSVTVKITSVDGDAVVVKNVGVASRVSVTASSNFGTPSAVVATSPAVTKSTFSSAKQVSTLIKAPEISSPVSKSTSASVSTTVSVPGANFVEINTQTTSLALVGTPILSTYTTLLTTAPVSLISTEPSYTLLTSKAPINTVAPSYAPSVGTTSAYTFPVSSVSGSVPSSTIATSFLPISSASKMVAGFGYLIAVCVAVLF